MFANLLNMYVHPISDEHHNEQHPRANKIVAEYLIVLVNMKTANVLIER